MNDHIRTPLLDRINSPADVHLLSESQLEILVDQLPGIAANRYEEECDEGANPQGGYARHDLANCAAQSGDPANAYEGHAAEIAHGVFCICKAGQPESTGHWW